MSQEKTDLSIIPEDGQKRASLDKILESIFLLFFINKF